MIRRGLLPAWLLLACAVACRQGGEEQVSAVPPATCRRVVALAPSLTETMFALGLGSRLVGVDDYSHWPAAVERLPHLGGLLNPNLEAIAAIRPDLVLLVPSERELGETLRRLGIDSLVVTNETVEDVEASFHAVARRCGVPEAGARVAADFHAALQPRPLAGRPRVLISTGRTAGRLADLVVAGPHTFFDQLLARLGAVNAFADAPVRYPTVGMEEVVARAPEVIIELRAEVLSPQLEHQLIADWQVLPQLPAVRDGRVRVIAGLHVLIPGPRLPRFYRDLRRALEPAR